MAKRITKEQFEIKAREVHGDRFNYSLVEYKNYLTPVKIICKEHGVFEQKPNNHLAGAICQKCSDIVISQKMRGTTESFIEKARKVHGDKYDYSLVDYVTSGDVVKIICKKHEVFEQIAHNHLIGRGCARCAVKNDAFDMTDFVERANAVHDNKYDYSLAIYSGYKRKMKIICREHGVFEQDPNNHLQGKGCSVCIGRESYDTESFVRCANVVHNNLYDYSNTEYIDSTGKVEIICEEHGSFFQQANNHLSGNGCPKCDVKISKGEQELFDFVKEICPDAEQSNRKLIKPKELDIVIPSKNIAIEFNGLLYHSDRYEGRSDNYHLDKTNACEDVGYRLIHIWEDDWRDKKDIVKNIISSILGHSKSEKIFARKCTVAKIDSDRARSFFDDNHIQGWANGNFHYALREESGRIVAAMTFSSRTSVRAEKKDGVFELTRYATSENVIGGAGKLIAAFVKDNPDFDSIISYSDNEIYTGGMYEALGFDKVNVGRPDYKVVMNGTRRHKSGFTLEKLKAKLGDRFDHTLTERENCRNNGLFRVYNCGLTKWVYKKLP